MTPEILHQVGAAVDCLIQVETGNAPGGTGDEVIGLGQDYGRFVEGLDQTGSHNPDHSLVPVGIVDDRGGRRREGSPALDHFKSLLGDFPVDRLAFVVVVVDLLAHNGGGMLIGGRQEFDRESAGLHAAGGIDPGTYLENDVIDGQMPRFKFRKGSYRLKPLARILIELSEPEMGQDAILPGHRDKVGGNADYQQVKQGDKGLEGDVIFS